MHDVLKEASTFKYAHEAISRHFAGIAKEALVASSRQFPGHMRADTQAAVEKLFAGDAVRFFGVLEEQRFETLTFATLTKDGEQASIIAPVQYGELDIGEQDPIKCLYNGLWLCRQGGLSYVALLSQHREYGRETGIRVEIAVPAGEEGSLFVGRCFRDLELAIKASRSYRGKVLSLEQKNPYSGKSSGVMVHRLPAVEREDVILPQATLDLLERNVLRFVGNRDRLRALGQSTKKGILLYGPPGTGKTHTIRYLASHLADHTTLIITAEQVGLLDEYMSLARLLQPALVVIEDVDLIARDRKRMGGPCEEVMLNMLLNEMDGLREDADIIFVLTTNRPGELEAALADRPGRIDQSIEVPLPDDAGREKLVRLYGRGLDLDAAIVSEAVKRTQGVSPAFIKELMRRTAQASIERQDGNTIVIDDLRQALDDMLFVGGKLNTRLLGGAGALGKSSGA